MITLPDDKLSKATRRNAETIGITSRPAAYSAERAPDDEAARAGVLDLPDGTPLVDILFDADVIGAYGRVLEQVARSDRCDGLKSLSLLPYPKDAIVGALNRATAMYTDEADRDQFEGALLLLDDFVADDQIPSDPTERLIAWQRHVQRASDERDPVDLG